MNRQTYDWVYRATADIDDQPAGKEGLAFVYGTGRELVATDGFRIHATPHVSEYTGRLVAIGSDDELVTVDGYGDNFPKWGAVIPEGSPQVEIVCRARFLRDALKDGDLAVLRIYDHMKPIEVLSLDDNGGERYALIMPMEPAAVAKKWYRPEPERARLLSTIGDLRELTVDQLRRMAEIVEGK